jgi:hypothetical protein
MYNLHTINQNNNLFVPGQFLYVNDSNTKEMLQNAWIAITQLDLWDYMRRETDSFMFIHNPVINIITNKMEELGYNGHSGSSFGWTMRQMQYIAEHGESNYMDSYLTNNK